MIQALLIAATCVLAMAPAAHATLAFNGVIDDVQLTRTDLGGGWDAIVITVDIGADAFTVLDGGFVPLGGVSFRQNNSGGVADATPAAGSFASNQVPADDTTFLLSRDFGDPSFEGPGGDNSDELSTLSIAYATPISGAFELARLVVPSGGDFTIVGGAVTPNSIPLIRSGAVLGEVWGSSAIVAVPEANTALIGGLITLVGLVRRRAPRP